MAVKILRKIRIEGNVAFIPLTKGFEAIIDAADIHLVNDCNWCAHVKQRTVYAARHTPVNLGKKQTLILLHRIIMAAPDDMEVDHEDGEGLNNRRYNLRIATHQQNAQNQRLNSVSTSGVKGVWWNKGRGKWVASITLNKRHRHLGCFDKKLDAAAAYAKASAELHGEFGRLG